MGLHVELSFEEWRELVVSTFGRQPMLVLSYAAHLKTPGGRFMLTCVTVKYDVLSKTQSVMPICPLFRTPRSPAVGHRPTATQTALYSHPPGPSSILAVNSVLRLVLVSEQMRAGVNLTSVLPN